MKTACKIYDRLKLRGAIPDENGAVHVEMANHIYAVAVPEFWGGWEVVNFYVPEVLEIELDRSKNKVKVLGEDKHRKRKIVSRKEAERLVMEGRAAVIGPAKIKLLFTPKELKKYVLERDNHTCQYCGGVGDTIDHVIPRSKGGLSTPENCVCACFECNQRKGRRSLEEIGGFGAFREVEMS